MRNEEVMPVQVCYTRVGEVILVDVQVSPGTTIMQAIERSGVLKQAPEINLQTQKVGVFGKLKSLEARLHPNDRVEIYRPLVADPMEARRRRAAKHGR
ncbi:RnfH family protein [Undibacterium sp. SXout11W]|uniref:RnfH family protein n=1 Tax=Undibacterium sp. SXout11W TaxID=3413050 RepID=UPI003BF011CE